MGRPDQPRHQPHILAEPATTDEHASDSNNNTATSRQLRPSWQDHRRACASTDTSMTFQQTLKTTSKTDRKHVGFRRSRKKDGRRACMTTRKKEEKMKICQTHKNAHTELFCVCFQENICMYIYILIYTPVEITYNVFLSGLLLFTTKELSRSRLNDCNAYQYQGVTRNVLYSGENSSRKRDCIINSTQDQ